MTEYQELAADDYFDTVDIRDYGSTHAQGSCQRHSPTEPASREIR